MESFLSESFRRTASQLPLVEGRWKCWCVFFQQQVRRCNCSWNATWSRVKWKIPQMFFFFGGGGVNGQKYLAGGNSNMSLCSTRNLVKWSNLKSIFLQMGWFSHQRVEIYHMSTIFMLTIFPSFEAWKLPGSRATDGRVVLRPCGPKTVQIVISLRHCLWSPKKLLQLKD